MIETEQFLEISRSLEKHHGLFYLLWEMGKPSFTNTVETAGVQFNKDGNHVAFLFNINFWNSLSEYERTFIICHECLHISLNHGVRAKDAKNYQASNVAMDIVVNHILVNKFGFDRSKISKELDKKLCWTDTVFPGKKINSDQNFEYYYNMFEKDYVSCQSSIDDHSKLGSSNWDEVGSSLNEKMNDEEKEGIKDIVQSAGKQGGSWFVFVDIKKYVAKKKKWETVIKNWSKKYIKEDFKDKEQWARINRRFSFLGTDLLLPSEMEIDETAEEKNKIDVLFFQDTSGSCYSFRDRFFAAARSLPPEKFNIELCCFDTEVYETSIESGELYGFGVTSFQILEDYVQEKVSKGGKYPEAIFTITDGMADDHIDPKFPKKWYFFLSYNFTNCISKKCNIFNLKDFE